VLLASRRPSLKALRVFNGRVYFASTLGIYAVDATGGMPELLSSDVNNVIDIAVHGGAIYRVNQGDVAGSTGSIWKLAL